MTRHLLAAFASLSLTVPGCLGASPEMTETQVCAETFKDIPVGNNRDIDILFIIDNGPSMSDERDSLVMNMPRFANVLENIDRGLPDVHIGFVTTDMGGGSNAVPGCTERGDDGRMHARARSDCTAPADPYLVDIAYPDGGRQRNYTGSLADAMACIAPVGDTGCRFSQPLAAMRRALDGSHPDQAGFLRDDAFLFVVIITDNDDCSARDTALFAPDDETLGPPTQFRCFENGVACDPDQPRTPGVHENCAPRDPAPHLERIEEYVDFVKSLKADPGRVLVSVVTGEMEPVEVITDTADQLALAPSCQSATASATPAVRLEHFAALFPQRSVMTSICTQDIVDAMLPIAETLTPFVAVPCLHGDIDLDPGTDGLQVECSVTDVFRPDADTRQETVLPRCPGDDPNPDERPCWHLDQDFAFCPDTATGATLEVLRGSASVPQGTYVNVRCATPCETNQG